MKINYQSAGVDIHEGYRAVEAMKSHIKRTQTAGVLTDIGSFGGLFQIPMEGMTEPVLVSGTDGVGTKLKIAFMADVHHTVGEDLVAMCVNDVLCQGARPLYFLDYIATGKLEADKAAKLVEGIANGCVKADCALIGGETAEMPGFYSDGEYDMAGFTVGLVDKSKIIDGTKIETGDVVIGLASSGFHSNGYSLIRKLVFEVAGLNLADLYPGTEQTVQDVLLKPTEIYVKPFLALQSTVNIKGAAHITGGGFIENIPRTLPEGLGVKIEQGSWRVPACFKALQSWGNLDDKDMYNTFNMGIGFVVIVPSQQADLALQTLKSNGVEAYRIGWIIESDQGVVL